MVSSKHRDDGSRPGEPHRRSRFGDFEYCPETTELWRDGQLVPLQPQPAKVLELLLDHAGNLVLREQLRAHVWGDEVEVDFDQGLNYCLKHIRRALGDSAEAPTYIATVPRRGYRFLAPVRVVDQAKVPMSPQVRSPVRRLAWGAIALGLGLFMAGALLRPAGAPPIDAPPRLVVLPFVDLSPAGDDAILGAGLAQELTTRLARRHGDRLGLIASTSAMTYRGSDKPIDQISAELGVDFVLEGSVRRSTDRDRSEPGRGERLRITAQLIRAADQSHVWANTYETDPKDLLTWQAEVANEVATAALPPILAAAASRSTQGHHPPLPDLSPEAYEAYLEARYLAEQTVWGAPDPRSLAAARRAFERTLELAPGTADAYSRLAWVRVHLAASTTDQAEAEALAHRALELDPQQSRARALLAFSSFNRFQWDAAEAHVLRAIAQEPQLPTAHQLNAYLLSAQGRHDEAVAAIETARRLDPVSLDVGADRALLYFYARRYKEAIRHARQVIELDPQFPCAYRWLIAAALADGDRKLALQQARAEVAALVASHHSQPPRAPIESLEDYWRWRLGELHDHPRARPVSPAESSVSYVQLGENERAIEGLIEACRSRSGWMLSFLDVDPRFDALRGDPRFDEILDCVSPARGARL
ncbi:MAG: winged helix-turn-helix domain-containing protein [Acidobacteriota bacterium]